MEKSVKDNNIRFSEVFSVVLADLPPRSQEIVAKRFGIGETNPLTLQAIGDEYGITRERVRQIVQSGLKNVQNADENENLLEVKKVIIAHIEDNDGIISVDGIVSDLGDSGQDEGGAIRFFLESAKEVETVNSKKYQVDDNVIALSDFDIDEWVKIHDLTKQVLDEKQKTYTSERLSEKITDEHDDVDNKKLENYLFVSRKIGKNPFDKWGLYKWDEISPRGVREKALLIMGEKGEPMHFREIAESIDEYGLGKKGKKSHPQTVHNELIRDDNFVLVGRGVYTLNNDDYVEGTVKDVIENVLKNSDEPLTAEEVIERVLENRDVKPSTIKVNLGAVAKKMNQKYTLDTKAK
ncbi:MAG: HTH domain-containing protein [Patescibacteria group bacterium]